MGYATTRSLERVAAAMGGLQAAPIIFEPARDVPQGGVLLALPALLAMGLLREKLRLRCTEVGRAARWNAALAREWMTQHEQEAQGLAFYVDGHVRVYHGELTKLARHYVARERLYLRATVDYWVNALDGEPFFYINKEVDHAV
jgi:hypothetical protein